jgi:hypothetical protein
MRLKRKENIFLFSFFQEQQVPERKTFTGTSRKLKKSRASAEGALRTISKSVRLASTVG